MPDTRVPAAFYSGLSHGAGLTAPVNAAAVLQEKQVAFSKASSLFGYQTYLAQCRAWKAAQTSVPASFGREVLTHARQALADGHDLVASALRVTRQIKQTGRLDNLVASFVAGVQASGPVQVQDLWSDIAGNQQTRQLLHDQGLSDDVFAAVDGQMQRVQGRLMAQGGKLAAEIGLAGQPAQTFVLAPSTTGSPRSLDDLLRRGQFERVADQFEKGGPLPFVLVPGDTTERAPSDVLASAAVVAVQFLAQHTRKLEDTGLAVYAGNDPVTQEVAAILIASIVLDVAGAVLMDEFCPPGKVDGSAGCIAGLVALGLAALVPVVGLGIVLGKPGVQLGLLWDIVFAQPLIDVLNHRSV